MWSSKFHPAVCLSCCRRTAYGNRSRLRFKIEDIGFAMLCLVQACSAVCAGFFLLCMALQNAIFPQRTYSKRQWEALRSVQRKQAGIWHDEKHLDDERKKLLKTIALQNRTPTQAEHDALRNMEHALRLQKDDWAELEKVRLLQTYR